MFMVYCYITYLMCVYRVRVCAEVKRVVILYRIFLKLWLINFGLHVRAKN